MDVILVLVAILVLITLTLVLYATWNYGSLEMMGVPVVQPFLVFGSNYNQYKCDPWTSDLQRLSEYGEIYGVYDGRTPMLYISNPTLIRLITTVNFDHFVNHGWDIGSDSLYGNILDLLKDEKWKTMRASLTQIFSSGKIRQISSEVNRIGSEYALALEKECFESGGKLSGIKFKEFLAPMVIEIISQIFCGIQISDARARDNSFVQNMKVAMMHEEADSGSSWLSNIPKMLPFLHYFTPGFQAVGMDFLLPVMENVLQTQEKNGIGKGTTTGIDVLTEMWRKVETNEEYKRLRISGMTVMAQMWDFLLAGYIGFRDTFDNFMYEMAMNLKVQEKVYEEIKGATGNGPPTLETISNLPYLNACLQETTRLHVLVDRIERVCNKDWSYTPKNITMNQYPHPQSIKIPKGLQVIIPIAALHMNPEYYTEPEKFNPERFLPGQKETRDPYTYLGFGHGPRGCIAQRFSMEILKLLTGIFITRFQIHQRKDTKCETNHGGILFVTYKAILLDVSRRD